MDKDLLRLKLQMLARCVERVRSQNVSSAEELKSDLDKQEIVILNLQRAVQICVDVGSHVLLDHGATPETMADTFRKMGEKGLIPATCAENLVRAVAFRNIAVHQYDDLDPEVIFSVVANHLSDFAEFAKAVSAL